MDVLSDLLRSLRLNAHVFLHAEFRGTWAVDSSGQAKATFHMIARGSCWLHSPGRQAPIALRGGDLVVFPHDALHTISNSETPPAPALPRNQPSKDRDEGPATSLICGYFEFERHSWNPLLNTLPDMIVIKGEDAANTALMDTLIRFIIFETESSHPGGDVVIDKLAEVLFIHVIRTYMQIKKTSAGYIAALIDKQIGKVLVQLHANPGHPWSVEGLAQQAGMSRAAFAERFHRLVNMTPMQYVACWRMQRAHEKLTTSNESVAQIAAQLGYQAEASFRKVFKKHFGFGPGVARKKA